MKLIFFLLGLFPFALKAQTYPEIKDTRPRIYYDSSSFAWGKGEFDTWGMRHDLEFIPLRGT